MAKTAVTAVQFVAIHYTVSDSRIVLYPCSFDLEKVRALGSSQESNSLCPSTCITVHFLDATITFRVRVIFSPVIWSDYYSRSYFVGLSSDFDVVGVLSPVVELLVVPIEFELRERQW